MTVVPVNQPGATRASSGWIWLAKLSPSFHCIVSGKRFTYHGCSYLAMLEETHTHHLEADASSVSRMWVSILSNIHRYEQL